jgi:hypothetical protein
MIKYLLLKMNLREVAMKKTELQEPVSNELLTPEEEARLEAINYQVILTMKEFCALIRYFNYYLNVKNYKRHLVDHWGSMAPMMLSDFESAKVNFVHNAVEIQPN